MCNNRPNMLISCMVQNKIVLITGASSGIGLVTAVQLAEQGYIVFASSRRGNSSVNLPNLHFVQADVNDKDQMKNVIELIVKQYKKIDVVICNAGNGIAGAIEDCSSDEIRFQMETNFYGVVNTIQQCLPYLREQKNGKILVISSLAAIFPIPYQAFYAASKAAVHILTQALSIELKRFNIQVCSILPGDTKTNFTKARSYAVQAQSPTSVYKEKMLASVAKMEQDEQNGMKPDNVAKTIVKQVMAKKMGKVIVPGISNKILYGLAQILPTKLLLALLHKLYN